MKEIASQDGVDTALDALLHNRLTLLCGAGLSMAEPSSIPSAQQLAESAKDKYDATYGATRPPLPSSIDEQAQFFFERDELYTVYLNTYIDRDAFSARPNSGHFAVADLMLVRGITTTVSTNVDTLIENAGNILFGQIGAGVNRANMINLPDDKAPLLKIHGCWNDPGGTIWATGQIKVDPIMTRIGECRQWLETRLPNRDLLIVGFWTDWDYLNMVLENSLGTVNPSRVIVVDPCETSEFEEKAPTLYSLGRRATVDFFHVRSSSDTFLERLRVDFSKSFIRRILHSGKTAFQENKGYDATAAWLEPDSEDPEILWQMRRDLEGCNPSEPAKQHAPADEPLLGMTILQLQARGAVPNGSYWKLGETRIRVVRAANQPLHEVKAAFSGKVAPAIAPDVTVAVGAGSYSLLPNIARGSGNGSIVRGPSGKWLSRDDAVEEFDL